METNHSEPITNAAFANSTAAASRNQLKQWLILDRTSR